MRKILLFVLGALLLPLSFGGASLAMADSGPQAFSMYCDPYTAPFVQGSSYDPQDGQFCTFASPFAPSVPIKIMAIYKGTVGSSTLLNYRLAISDPSTTFSLLGTIFTAGGAPQPGDNFFGAAYTGDDLNAVPYLTQGSGVAPADMQVVAWHWGAALTLQADNKVMNAGAALPTFTYTLSGFVSPDTQASNNITGTAACTTTATSASGPGDYPITCAQGTLASAKYAFDIFNDGTLHISPAPADAIPPTITITSPQNGHTYTKNQVVLVLASIIDVSPIATSSYNLNGAFINPLLPIPTSAVGSKVLVVSATDSFGNKGFATSTFTVVAPDVTAPTITITSPLKNGLYKKTDSVFLTATVTDASPIATTTYWLNGKKINPAVALDLSTAPTVSKVSVSATDSFGNTATTTQAFYIVKSTNSCLLDIIAILTAIKQDNTLPDKPTIQNLIADCTALLKGLHRHDDDGHHH